MTDPHTTHLHTPDGPPFGPLTGLWGQDLREWWIVEVPAPSGAVYGFPIRHTAEAANAWAASGLIVHRSVAVLPYWLPSWLAPAVLWLAILWRGLRLF